MVIAASARAADAPDRAAAADAAAALEAEPPLVRLTDTPTVAERQPAWSPDGKWIAFVADEGGRQDLWILSADGASRRRLTNDPHAEGSPAWSPDGKRITFHAAHEGGRFRVWTVNLADSTVAAVTDEPGRTMSPAWSPDGKEIAYFGVASGDEQVWAIPAAGGAPRRLTFHKTQSWSAAWSPDGKEIAFSGYRNEKTGGSLFIMPRHGEGAACERSRALTRRTDHGWDRFPAWSPDGRWIAFAARSGANDFDIWLVAVDGSVEARLTTNPAVDTEPAWSPDSRRLVFQSNRSGNDELWALDASRWVGAGGAPAGPALRLLTDSPDNDYAPTWSPDGREVLFHSWRDGVRDLWVVSSEGGAPRRLDSGPGIDQYAAWAPDGSAIAYTTQLPATLNQEVYLLPIGGPPRPLAATPAEEFRPAWSPDGHLVAFTSTASGSPDIWAIDPASGDTGRLLVGGESVEGYASWSPQGDRLLFQSDRSGRLGIWVAPFDREKGSCGAPAMLVGGDGEFWQPSWSPSGDRFVFLEAEGSRRRMAIGWVPGGGGAAGERYRVPLPDSLSPNYPDWSPDGRSIAFSAYAGGSSKIWVVTDAGGFEPYQDREAPSRK